MRTLRVCMFPVTTQNEVIDTIVLNIRAQYPIEFADYHFLFSFFRRCDIFHVHWPDAVLFPAPVWRTYVKYFLFLAFVILSKLVGRRIVWTVHNMESHERRFEYLEAHLWEHFLCRVDCLVHMCEQSLTTLKGDPRVAGAHHVLIPHPHYRETYPHPPTRAEARLRLSIPERDFVFLFFGMIRVHKGVEELIDEFIASNLAHTRLVIAGKPIYFPEERLAKAQADPNILLLKGFIPRELLQDAIRAADVVVLPYRKILNSGVAVTALSLGRPILAPRAGVILDLAARLGDDWVNCFDAGLKASDLVKVHARMSAVSGARLENDASPDLDWMSPTTIASELLDVYFSVVEQPLTL